MRQTVLSLGAALIVAATAVPAEGTESWRKVATNRDERRIGNLADSWTTALSQARRSDSRQVARLGRVVVRTAALPRPYPTPANYRCRTIKLGSQSDLPELIVYGWFRCRIELTPGGDLILSKVTGSQRQRGLLYPHDNRTLVFLGTLALSSSERRWARYGSNPERDIAGVFERIGAGHYRLVMPEPEFESKLDILELKQS